MGALSLLPVAMPVLVGWVAWLVVGLGLAVWTRAARRLAREPARVPRPSAVRPAHAARPISGLRPPSSAVSGDAFGELQALLGPLPESTSRRPGD